jgi:hypothetical protein
MSGPLLNRTRKLSNLGRPSLGFRQFVAVEEPGVVKQRVQSLSQARKAADNEPSQGGTAPPPPSSLLREQGHADRIGVQQEVFGSNGSNAYVPTTSGPAVLPVPGAAPLRHLSLPSDWDSDDIDSDEDCSDGVHVGGCMDDGAANCNSKWSMISLYSSLDLGEHDSQRPG